MKRFAAAPLLLSATLAAAPGAMPADVLTIAQRGAQRFNMDRASVDISGDGRYVAFTSCARLAPADTNSTRDVYVLDRTTGIVTLESLPIDGIATGYSDNPDLSGDGRFLAYETRLIFGDAELLNVALRDRQEGHTRILSRGLGGQPANGPSHTPAISGDGRLVAFSSAATNLVPDADANGVADDIYYIDVVSGMIQRIGLPADSASVAPGSSVGPSVDATGRYVAFASSLDLDREKHSGVYVHDRQLRTTTHVSVGRGGQSANAGSWAPAMGAGGRYVAFVSAASNLVSDDDNRVPDVFVTEWQTGSIELVSRSTKGRSGNDASASPAISADGRFVAFESEASNLVRTDRGARAMEDINLLSDVFLYDRQTRSMTRISGDERGPWMEPSVAPALDATARVVAFSSRHPMNGADRRNDFDLFIVTH